MLMILLIAGALSPEEFGKLYPFKIYSLHGKPGFWLSVSAFNKLATDVNAYHDLLQETEELKIAINAMQQMNENDTAILKIEKQKNRKKFWLGVGAGAGVTAVIVLIINILVLK